MALPKESYRVTRTLGPRLLLLVIMALLAIPSEGAARSRSRKHAKPPASSARPADAPAAQSPPPEAQAAPSAPAEVSEIQLGFDVPKGHPGERVVVTARLRDAGGRARDAALRLDPDAGTAEPPARVSAGVYKVRLTLPTALANRRSLLVIASAGQAVASVALPLSPGPAATLTVEAPPDLHADGANHPLWVGVRDAHGNPAIEPPRVTVTRGALGQPEPLATGEWMVDYRPPRNSRGGEDVVSVTAGAAVRSQPIALAPVPALVTVSPRAGVVTGAGGTGLAVGADAAVWPLDLPPSLGVVLGVMWWGARDSGSVAGPAGALELRTSRSWLPITLSAAARQRLGARATLTLSAGGGVAHVASRTTLSGQPAIAESAWAPVALAGVELAYPTRLFVPFVELRGGWVGDPSLDTVRGAAWPVMLLLGSRFDAY
jgi:hypothetical protein